MSKEGRVWKGLGAATKPLNQSRCIPRHPGYKLSIACHHSPMNNSCYICPHTCHCKVFFHKRNGWLAGGHRQLQLCRPCARVCMQGTGSWGHQRCVAFRRYHTVCQHPSHVANAHSHRPVGHCTACRTRHASTWCDDPHVQAWVSDKLACYVHTHVCFLYIECMHENLVGCLHKLKGQQVECTCMFPLALQPSVDFHVP